MRARGAAGRGGSAQRAEVPTVPAPLPAKSRGERADVAEPVGGGLGQRALEGRPHLLGNRGAQLPDLRRIGGEC